MNYRNNTVDGLFLFDVTTGLGGVFLYILHMEQLSKIFCIYSFSSLLFDHGILALSIKLMSLSGVGCENWQ